MKKRVICVSILMDICTNSGKTQNSKNITSWLKGKFVASSFQRLIGMAVTKGDRMRKKKATVEPTEAFKAFERARQEAIEAVAEDELNNKLKKQRMAELESLRRKLQKSEEKNSTTSDDSTTTPGEMTTPSNESSDETMSKKNEPEQQDAKQEKPKKKSTGQKQPAASKTIPGDKTTTSPLSAHASADQTEATRSPRRRQRKSSRNARRSRRRSKM